MLLILVDSKTRLKRPLKRRPKIGFKTNYRLMHVKSIEHSAILSTCIKLPSMSSMSLRPLRFPIFEWPLMTGFTV